jgi:hypothetical protein
LNPVSFEGDILPSKSSQSMPEKTSQPGSILQVSCLDIKLAVSGW